MLRQITGCTWNSRAQNTETEQTGKPTYHYYSSIPIEQESGPRAESQDPKRGKMTGNRRGVLGVETERSITAHRLDAKHSEIRH